jgi:hypothetical protein
MLEKGGSADPLLMLQTALGGRDPSVDAYVQSEIFKN